MPCDELLLDTKYHGFAGSYFSFSAIAHHYEL